MRRSRTIYNERSESWGEIMETMLFLSGAGIVVVLLWCAYLTFFLRRLSNQPTNEEVLDELEDLQTQMDNEIAEMHGYMADTNDRIEGVLQPILKRNTMRNYRADKEPQNLSTQKTKGIYGTLRNA